MRSEAFFNGLLMEYFAALPDEAIKTTKTLRKYKLPKGELVMKKQAPQILHDDEELLEWLDGNGMTELVAVKRSPRWAEVKARLEIHEDGSPVDMETGEIVPGISVIARADIFEVKF